ncbi:MAG: sulfur carrier protein ThiS [Nesterenkonia sp.]|uniref:sulfur carrier protein ThiS n=1 Tax=Nesterenkonia marinintestina TaxID=2979865 RepID=UPI0021BE5F57|nr:sulfur carrier protein ThiS [Nesterenkonia sp. GX14115]MDO5493962.1 sulfur carrier protein ThiS [Nesterenkonia sp.]
MPTITLNDETVDLPAEATVADAVTHTTGRELHDDGRPTDGRRLGVAVALDGAVVPRSTWATTAVEDGQTLEVVTAVQGG